MNANAGTIADETKQPNSRKSDAERSVVYRPAGATEDMTLTMAYVRGFLTTPTKQGHKPTEADIIKFMMLCKESHLNPWQGDAYLIGYDSEDGPVFNLITAVQALLKRAELSHEFDGIESGVVASKNGELIERKGTLLLGRLGALLSERSRHSLLSNSPVRGLQHRTSPMAQRP